MAKKIQDNRRIKVYMVKAYSRTRIHTFCKGHVMCDNDTKPWANEECAAERNVTQTTTLSPSSTLMGPIYP